MDNQTPNNQKPDPQQPQPPNRLSRSLMGWVMIIGLALLMMMFMTRGLDGGTEISIVEFWRYVDRDKVTGKINIHEQRIEGQLKGDAAGFDKPTGEDGTHKFYVIFSYRSDQTFQDKLTEKLAVHDNAAKPFYKPDSWWEGILPHLLVTVLLVLAIWFLLFRRIGAAGGGGGFLGSFGRSKHRVWSREHTQITFDDVAGIDEAKEEVGEIIEFLKNPRKFQRLGGRIPRGVLLVGSPGCGKTLLAKAIAGEADVPFFSISGSDFVEMFVGVGASRVRDLFKQAKDSSPCIIFLDEIDAVGRRRTGDYHGGGQETAQTLNAILVEMDGFDSSDQVIVLAATNRLDVLDPALTRPGRFARQITVPLPDLKGRFEILKIYATKVKCAPDMDLHRLARGTPMFSGADLAALINEAAIAATMADKEYVEQADVEEARDKVRWGRERKSRVIDEKEKESTAYHEAGHALVQSLVPDSDPLHKVSIIPRGSMGGATFSLPEKDRYYYTRRYCDALLAVLYGGRVAEKLFCDDVSSGAQNDIAQATDIARRMVLDWGMSDRLGAVNYASGDGQRMIPPELAGKDYSEQTAAVIDEEVRALIDQGYQTATRLIEENRDRLDGIAQALLKYETLGADEVQQILDGKTLDKPTVDDLLNLQQDEATEEAEPLPLEPPPVPDGPAPPDPLPEPGAP